MNAALAIIIGCVALAIGLGLRARRGHDMDLEQWTVGGRGFGTIFIFLLMAGEIYSTFTFLGGAGFAYGSGGPAYYILGYGTLAYVLSYYLLPAVWRYATPRKLHSQADVFTSAFGSRALGVVVSVVAVAAMIPYLALQLKGLGIIVSETSYGSISSTAAIWMGAVALSVYVAASGIRGSAWTATIKDVLTLSIVVFIGLYLPIHYFGGIGDMFRQVDEAKPGFLQLSGDQLTPVWFSSTVLLTALGFYMWPHTFGSALSAKNEHVFRRNAAFMPLYQLLIAFVFFVGFAALLRTPNLPKTGTDLALLTVVKNAFPQWFVGLIGSAGVLCALVPGSMLLIASATTVAKNIVRGINPEMSDAATASLSKIMVPVIALAGVAFVFAGGQTLVTLLLLGYALVTQLFPALVLALAKPGWVTKQGAIAGIVAGVGMVAAMSFAGATPETASTVDSLIPGLPPFLAQLNLGIVALVVNLVVMVAVSAATRGAPRPRPPAASGGSSSESRSGALHGRRHEVLADLHRRLDGTRWPDEAPDPAPEHGLGLAAARELADHWRDGYDWRAAEAVLNAFAQHTAPVAGIDLHFIAEGSDGPPLLLLHGWPSSVWEFNRVIGPLSAHARVVVPSLPGYGFSFRAGQRRFGIVDCADAIHTVMTDVLGHERYLVAGGDWGASIAVRLAHAYPDAVEALHLYMLPLRRPETWPESELASRRALAHWLEEEGGYVRIQGTRPQTLAYGLNDSPVGLMSWIAEKFDRWTDTRGVDRDDVLTMVTLYWVTGSIGASFWPYYARAHGEWVLDEVAAVGGRLAAPLTYLDFPKEIVHVPRAVAQGVFEIERWEAPDYGGHFPALEATDVLADSLRRFVSR